MTNHSSSTIGRIAISVGIVELIGLAFIAIFYAFIDSFGEPFGTLNDLCVALGGILSGWLVWKLHPTQGANAGGESSLGRASGLAGAVLAPLGSALVISNVTGWFLAGLVTTLGYALIGLWLLLLNTSARSSGAVPRSLDRFGILTGVAMAIGLLAAPGIFAGIDAEETAPWFVLVGLFLGGLGWNILYPIWCISFGRLLISNKLILEGGISASSTNDGD